MFRLPRWEVRRDNFRMRYLLQPQVLRAASIAAAVSALACYPRISLWLHRPGPVWYLESAIFTCSIVCWGFVFAWHMPYTGRPVFIFRQEWVPLAVATVTAAGSAVASHLVLDPLLRPKFPEEYPADLQHWLAAVPFVLTFKLLFAIFAPFDWLMRLLKNRWAATILIGLLGAALLLMNVHKQHASIPTSVLTLMLAGRFVAAFLAVWFYLRGGVLLVCWWTFLAECRHLWAFVQ